ncbi:TPA: hypothetical protein NJ905_004426 [Vibrio parahaemolyticus]|nr:hypothetical protein [Vibrio parahaemolyticus]
MDSEEHNVKHRSENTLTFLSWYEHLQLLFIQQWKMLILNFSGAVISMFGFIELVKFFKPHANLNSKYVLLTLVAFSALFAILRCAFSYLTSVPKGLEDEPIAIQNIARSKKHFWEYAFVHERLKVNLTTIDSQLEDVLNDRVHINIVKELNADEYIKWVQIRPQNVLRIVQVAKQLLIVELVNGLSSSDDHEVDYQKFIRLTDLITDLYKDLYQYEVDARQIAVPDEFRAIHDMQSEWVVSIRDGFQQMMSVLHSISVRNKNDLSPVRGTIVFEEPPRLTEFSTELQRLIEQRG